MQRYRSMSVTTAHPSLHDAFGPPFFFAAPVVQKKENTRSPMWTLNDQPGRWLAVTVFAPILWWRGWLHGDAFIIGFSVLLFFWDAFWLVMLPPRALLNPRSSTACSH